MKLHRSMILISAITLLTACGNAGNSYSPNMMNPGAYGQQAYGQQAYGQQQFPQQPGGLTQPLTAMNPGMNPGMNQQLSQQMPQTGAILNGMNQGSQTAPQQMPQQNAMPGMILNGIPQQLQPGIRGPQRVSAPRPGTMPPQQAAPPQNISQAPQAAPQQAPQAAPQLAAPHVDPAQEFLGKLSQAFAALKGMDATVSSFEKGTSSGTAKFRYQFQKPGQVRIDVLQSDDASRKGVKLSYQSGSNSVKARATGMLSIVAVNLAMTDPKVKSGRQYLLSQIDLSTTVNRLSKAQGAKAIGKTNYGGAQVVILEIPAQNHFDPQITKERIAIDMNTNLLRMHEMYVGEELVYAARIEQLQVNPAFAGNAFDI